MANPDFTGVLSSDRSSFEGELPGSIHFGIQGPPGPPGKDGTVAFEDLTAEQIERLRGPKGPSGKTAYEYALDGGYTGSETDFVTKLTTEYLPLSGGDMTGELKMNGQPISGLNDPTANDQAANMGFVNQRVRKAAPRNLLDNSDFRNPVNQRGITVSNNGFIVDRWYAFDGDVTISENGIFTTGNGYIQQRLLSGTIKPESVYTLAVYYSDGTADVNTNGEYASIADFDIVNYIRSNGKTISAVALYEGEYTIDTLPEYQSKGYANELLVCNQYDPETGEYIGITSTPTDAVLKSNVVNNFTTTEEGYVADARIAKALYDFLKPKILATDAVYDGTYTFEKSGNVVVCYGYLNVNNTVVVQLTDERLIPKQESIRFITAAAGNAAGAGTLYSSGEFMVHTGGFFNFSYIVEEAIANA